jgi:hypothetical protein
MIEQHRKVANVALFSQTIRIAMIRLYAPFLKDNHDVGPKPHTTIIVRSLSVNR